MKDEKLKGSKKKTELALCTRMSFIQEQILYKHDFKEYLNLNVLDKFLMCQVSLEDEENI